MPSVDFLREDIDGRAIDDLADELSASLDTSDSRDLGITFFTSDTETSSFN
jgi:hypothetical protein